MLKLFKDTAKEMATTQAAYASKRRTSNQSYVSLSTLNLSRNAKYCQPICLHLQHHSFSDLAMLMHRICLGGKVIFY